MTEWPDKRLDDLFRKSAEEIKPEYDPNDWNELRKRLDEEDKPMGMPWWKMAGLGLGLALLLGGLIGISLYLWKDESTEKVTPSSVTRMGSAAQERKSSDATSSNRKLVAATEGKTILPRSQPKASGVRVRTARPGSGRGTGAFFSNFTTKRNKQIASNREGNELVENSLPGEEKQELEAGRNEKEYRSKEEDGRVGILGVDVLSVRSIGPRTVVWKDGQILSQLVKWPNVVFVDSSSGSEEERKSDTPVSFHKWAVRVGVSPDLSTVGLKNFSSPKTAAGLLVEYGISQRLFVQAGIVRSLKVYTASAGDYQLPAGVKQSVYPSSVDGECVVLEVPVNLRYTVFNRPRSGWFASGGISSYQMRKENYDYNYDKHYPGVKYGWSGKTGWYWLSHVNASIGYEYKLNKRLSLIAEPYLRLPIKRVGYGKVNLITTGAWLSVRYTPIRRK